MEKKQNWYVNQKKFHVIYKTTCKASGKYYIGMHSTDNLDDGYLGSGTILGHSLRKYGRENHSIEVLEFLFDRESLRKRERQIVCEEVIGDKFCMNLRLGGEGWESKEASIAAAIGNRSEVRTKNPEYLKKISQISKDKAKAGIMNYEGMHRSDVQGARLRGRKCVHKDGINKKVLKERLEEFLSNGWFIGRLSK